MSVIEGRHSLDVITAARVTGLVVDFCEKIPAQTPEIRCVIALCRCIMGDALDRLDQQTDLDVFLQHIVDDIVRIIERNRLGADDLH